MADIIRFDRDRRHKRLLLLEAVGRMMQCTACHRRCTKCGMAADEDARPLAEYEAVLCQTCATEYQAYRDRREGRGDREAFWLNEAWMDTWTTWLAHQKANLEFRKSKEFQRLLNEPPDMS